MVLKNKNAEKAPTDTLLHSNKIKQQMLYDTSHF